MSRTVQLDEQISRTARGSEQFLNALRAARAHLERLHAHAIQTRGRAFADELAALPDLDRLHEELIDTEHVLQDAGYARTNLSRHCLDAVPTMAPCPYHLRTASAERKS